MATATTLTMGSILLRLIPLLFGLQALSAAATRSAIFSDLTTLFTGETLVNGGNTLTMNKDCQLFLTRSDKTTWNSSHPQPGFNCTFSVNAVGLATIVKHEKTRDVIVDSFSQAANEDGSYAVVLTPTGEIGMYGDVMWAGHFTAKPVCQVAGMPTAAADGNTDVLFSSDDYIMPQEALLESGEYKLIVDPTYCSFHVEKGGEGSQALLQESTSCKARLTTEGELVLVLKTEYTETEGVAPVFHRVFGTNITREDDDKGFVAALVPSTGEVRIYPWKDWIGKGQLEVCGVI